MRIGITLVIAGWVAAVSSGDDHVGLAWRTTLSPDGESLVYVAERRVSGVSEYTLTLMEQLQEGYAGVTYSLTPRYTHIVEAPSGDAIAYFAHDSALHSPLCVYGQTRRWSHPYPAVSLATRAQGTVIQWSRDGRFVRCRISDSRGGRPLAWRVGVAAGSLVRKAAAADAKWVRRGTAPSDLPSFMTQRQPAISREMPIVWGHDSKAVYVADEEGVWRVTLGEPFMPVWHKVCAASNIQALAMSPSGNTLVVESGVEEEREVHELTLSADDVEVRHVISGWGVTFADGEDMYFFANYKGYYVVRPGEKPREIRWAARRR
jgi:hypothetical protein